MANITDKQMEVLINIIGAVETGGQVYGQRRYNDYTNAYTNSSAEHSITIGAFQEYNSLAKGLLKEIQEKYPQVFSKYDNAGIASDIQKSSWVGYNPAKTSAKAKAIVNIINSSEGQKVQDERIARQMKEYIAYAENLGVSDIDALFMCANFIHQGGYSACKRILAKTSKPYTLDKLYNSTLSDTGNQVGAYRSRQKMVYNSLKKYLTATSATTTETNTKTEVRTMSEYEKLVSIMESEVGYLEKASNSNLDSKTSNAGSNNYTKYWRDLANWGLGDYQAQYWCAAFVHWCFVKAFGLARAKELLLHAPFIYCPTLANLSNSKGQLYSTPKVGDVVLFWSSSQGTYGHTGVVIKVDSSYFYTIEGNTSGASGVIANGGGVVKGKKYPISGTRHRFHRPKYKETVTETNKIATKTTTNNSYVGKGIGTATALYDMNIRSGCGTDYESYNVISKGTKVEVLEVLSSGWLKIAYTDSPTGYAYTSNSKPYYSYIENKTTTTATTTKKVTTIKTKKATNTGLNKTQKWVGQVTVDVLNVRTWAGTNNPLIKSYPQLAYGNKVAVCDSVKDSQGVVWYYVLIANKYYGFVHSDYIEKA